MDTLLQKKIMAFKIDSGNDELTFVGRLARENGWSQVYAQRCVLEYKRFICLAMSSGCAVTPSDQVDQVWHLHLTYTQSYWDDLCGQILSRPLHHGPTKGGAVESNKYRAQYQTTLDNYRNVFKTTPPQDIWPSTNDRFHNADKFVRLNSADYVLLRKRSMLSWTGIAVLPLLLAACVSVDSEIIDKGILGLFSFVCVYILYKYLFKRKSKKKGGSGCGSGCGGNNGGSGCGSGCGGCGG